MHIFSLIQPEFLYSCRLVIVKLVKDVELMFNLLLWNFLFSNSLSQQPHLIHLISS